jgi:hypothetical protein
VPDLPQGEKSPIRGAVTRLKILETGQTWIWEQVRKKEIFSSEVTDVKILFRIEFVNDPSLNWGVVRVLGIGPQDVEKIHVGMHVDLEAGWRWDDPGNWLQLRGATIERIEFSRETDTTWGAELVIYDAPEEWLRSVVNRSWKPGTKASQIVKDISAIYMPHLEWMSYKPKRDVIYRRGRTFMGIPVRWAIEDVARDMASRIFTWNRKLYLHGPGKGTRSDVFLDYDHGLLTVQRLETSVENKPTQDDEYFARWLVRAMIQPRLGPDSIFHLKSKHTEGDFRVLYGKHYSDSKKWQTEVAVTDSEDFSVFLEDLRDIPLLTR